MTKTPATKIARGVVAKLARPPRAPKAAAMPKAKAEPKPVTKARPAPSNPAPAPMKPEPTPKGPSKIDQVVALLKREEGATARTLMDATGWQAHSVRGVIAGAIKKKLGLTVISEAGEGGRTYRIVEEDAA